MSEKIYPQGLTSFKPHPNAPDFIIADILICPKVFDKWCDDHEEYLSDYRGDSQIKLQLKNGRKGYYLEVAQSNKGGSVTDKLERKYEATRAEQVENIEEDNDDTLPF